jgi:hypothetical protein
LVIIFLFGRRWEEDETEGGCFFSRIRKLLGQVTVNDINANFLCAQFGITVIGAQIFHQIRNVVPDSFVVGLEVLLVVILDSSPEVFVFKNGIQHLFL